MKTNEIKELAIEILNSSSLKGLRFKNQYTPKICYKCGAILDGFSVQTNGIYHCLTCELPIQKSKTKAGKEIFKGMVEKLKTENDNTLNYIRTELQA